jgi:hypothetical protein
VRKRGRGGGGGRFNELGGMEQRGGPTRVVPHGEEVRVRRGGGARPADGAELAAARGLRA